MQAKELLHILKTQNKRMFIAWLITFIAFIGLLGYTIWLLNDIGTAEISTQVVDKDSIKYKICYDYYIQKDFAIKLSHKYSYSEAGIRKILKIVNKKIKELN